MMAVSVHEAPYWEEACKVLKQVDPTLGDLIRASRGSVLRPRNDPFFSLARSIVSQQISVSAAETVWRKFHTHVGEITPGAVVCQTEDTLRKCGLTIQTKSPLSLGFGGAFHKRRVRSKGVASNGRRGSNRRPDSSEGNRSVDR